MTLSRAYAAIFCRAAPLIIAAPFSAIMIVGALVLVEVTAGITEASMTRRPSSPCTRNSAVDDAHRVRAHHAGAAGVIAGAAVAPRVIEQFVVGLDVRAGQGLLADELLSAGAANIRRAIRNPPMMARRSASSDR